MCTKRDKSTNEPFWQINLLPFCLSVSFEEMILPSGKKNSVKFSNVYFHIQACTEASIDGEVTQCSWQTLWLHNEHRVYTSHATVYAELVWPLLSSLSFFFFLG